MPKNDELLMWREINSNRIYTQMERGKVICFEQVEMKTNATTKVANHSSLKVKFDDNKRKLLSNLRCTYDCMWY